MSYSKEILLKGKLIYFGEFIDYVEPEEWIAENQQS